MKKFTFIALCHFFLVNCNNKIDAKFHGLTNEITLNFDNKSIRQTGVYSKKYTAEPKLFCGITDVGDTLAFNLNLPSLVNINKPESLVSPVAIHINALRGSKGKTGKYTPVRGRFIEFNKTAHDGIDYEIIGGNVYISEFGEKDKNTQYIEGTFLLTIKNNNHWKVVDGNFIIRDGHSLASQ